MNEFEDVHRSVNSAQTPSNAGEKREVSPTAETAPLWPHPALGTPADEAKQREPVAPRPITPTPSGSTGGPKPATFSSGDFVANRYRVIRFIGQGGMGEVYEVEDVELRTRVALKTIRQDVAGEERAIERFRREIQLARTVTHPNVCRIFDLGYHRRPVPQGDVVFLTMELLPGQTLTDYLHQTGRLTTDKALPIVMQIVSALSAAHSAGIVHGDFKSSNVVLVTAQERTRAVVTDFGLARRSGVGEGESGSVSGDFVGTPTYMAPEQVRGGKVTPASDIYALGVVMYEMLTGTYPFKGDTPLSTAVMRLELDPTPPRKFVPDLDPKWEATLIRCLERNPSRRYSTAEAVLGSLIGKPAPPQAQQRRTGILAAALAGLLVLVMGLLFVVAPRMGRVDKTATVRLNAAPWAEVVGVHKDNGERINIGGQTPVQLKLPPGHYVIEVRNHNLSGKINVVVEAGKMYSINYTFSGVNTDALVEKALSQE